MHSCGFAGIIKSICQVIEEQVLLDSPPVLRHVLHYLPCLSSYKSFKGHPIGEEVAVHETKIVHRMKQVDVAVTSHCDSRS